MERIRASTGRQIRTQVDTAEPAVWRDDIPQWIGGSLAQCSNLLVQSLARCSRIVHRMARTQRRLMQQLVNVIKLHRRITGEMGGQQLADEFHWRSVTMQAS